MSECYRYLFLKNENLKSCDDFKDHVLLQGISLYEVIRIISGRAIFLEEHYKRLRHSAQKVNQNIWYSFEQIEECVRVLVDKNDTWNGNIKLVFNIQEQNQNFYAYFVKHQYPSDFQYKNGVRTLVHPAVRPIPTAKVYNHSLRSKTNNLIQEAEIFEVLLMNTLGNITEGSRSNLFFIKENKLYTAPDHEVLNGIVRSKVIEIAAELNITLEKTSIGYDDLPKFDAAFITGTSPMILPICRINSLSYSVSHPLLEEISNAYQLKVKERLNIKTISK